MSKLGMLRLGIWALYAGALVYYGFRRKAGFASWHMFASLNRTRFRLTERLPDGSQLPFNAWRYLPHSFYGMREPLVRAFVFYLRRIHGHVLDGEVLLTQNFDEKTLRVEAGDVAD